MITPEQKQAWREEYLMEMKKISITPLFPTSDLSVDETVSLISEMNDSEPADHFAHFIFSSFFPCLKVFEYVLKNHPIVVANIDKDVNRIEADVLSRRELFDYLYSITIYGRERFFSDLQINETIKEALLEHINNNSFNDFEKIIDDNGIDISEGCTKVGYTNNILQFTSNQVTTLIQAFQDDEDSDDETIREWENRGENYIVNRGMREQADYVLTLGSKVESAISSCSTNLHYENEEALEVYLMILVPLLTILPIANDYFDEEEFAIVNQLLENECFSDISEDMEVILNHLK